MSSSKKRRSSTSDEEESSDEHLLDVYLDGLWDAFCRTNDFHYLILFIRRGGDISDQKTRDLIADLLTTPPQNPGGSQPMASVRFYNHVHKLMNDENMKKTKSVERVARIEGISTAGGWSRYRAGKKLSEA